MPASRLRLQLAFWFALAMVLGLAVLDIGLFLGLRYYASQRLTQEVHDAASGLAEAVGRERAETDTTTLAFAAHEALKEFPPTRVALVILAGDGTIVESRGDSLLLAQLPPRAGLPARGSVRDQPLDDESSTRIVAEPASAGATVVAIGSTAVLVEELETFATWLILSVPVVLMVSLPAGYLLARRALAPFQSLAAQLQSIQPGTISERLSTRDPPDELDQLAIQVNLLLDRLAGAQAQARRFLGHAAHQLRTPLTLIRGESDLALGRPRTAQEYQAVLGRVSRAAAQMSRRVDELFLFARAEAGEPITTRQAVEVDAVALEAVDLIRGRATAIQRELTLGTMDAAEVVGDVDLLREAALELLENACRHGTAAGPIRISVSAGATETTLAVSSTGAELPWDQTPDPELSAGEGGMGLAVVRWIASMHNGRLSYTHESGSNRYAIVLPRSTEGQNPRSP